MCSMMRSPARQSVHALALLVLLAAPGTAGAQDIATAEALFDQGLEDMKAGRYEKGCPAIAESQRLDPRPGTLFTLATCEAEWGHVATAASRYGDYVSVYERLPDDKRAAQLERHKVATAERERLLREVPYLTLVLPEGAPSGTVVKRDGEVIGKAALRVSLPVDPGEHVVSTQVPGGPVHEQKITIAKMEKKSVTLEVEAAKAKPSPAPTATATPGEVEPTATPAGGISGRRVATYVVGGVGLVGLVVGGVLGGLAVAQKGVMDQHCGAAIGQDGDPTGCDQMGFDTWKTAKLAADGSTVGLAAGGAAVAAALVLFITEPKATPPKPGAPATGKANRWVSAGVLSVGPSGAMLGVKGAW